MAGVVEQNWKAALHALISSPSNEEPLRALAAGYVRYYTEKAAAAVREGKLREAEKFVDYADAWRGFVPAILEEAGVKLK